MRRSLVAALAAACACAPAAPSSAPRSFAIAGETEAQANAAAAAPRARADAPLRSGPCRDDRDCGYDPRGGACTTDPRGNRQPPLIDQGIVCYCEAEACAILRVAPVPCEGDDSCAVRLDPRPHPAASRASLPHERGRACVDYAYATTCERTNICTMRDLGCPAPQPAAGSAQQRTPSE